MQAERGAVQIERLRGALSVVVLGMLSEEPLHPYGMSRRIKERAYDRLPGVKVSSLYDTVRRLGAAGLIRADAPHRSGNRPERTPFVITDAGRDELQAWIQRTLADEHDPDGLPAALSFMYSLGPKRVVDVLTGRLARMSAMIDADQADLARSASDNPIFVSEHRYQLARRRAERDWIADFLHELDAGTISWP